MTGTVRLSRFRIEAFRSCKKTTIIFNPGISCLIGANGAGKTNVLSALLLLKKGPRRVIKPDRDVSNLTCRIEANFTVGDKVVELRSKLMLGSTERTAEEILDREDQWRFKGFDWTDKPVDSKEALIFLDEQFKANRAELFFHRSRRFSRHSAYAKVVRKYSSMPKSVPQTYQAVQTFIKSITYCGASQFTNPSLCPSSFEVDEDGDLRETYSASREHTRFIFSLYKFRKNKPQLYDKFISLVNEDGLKIIDRIDWQEMKFETSGYEVRSGANIINKNVERNIIIPILYVGDSKLSFNQLSEGTFRTLALLYYIVSENNQLLLLEEPEVSVHHGLLGSIVEIAKDMVKSKQVILSTHSEAVVDCFEPENIYLVNRDPTAGTVVSKITKTLSKNGFTALKHYLRTSGSLGEFWRHGGF